MSKAKIQIEVDVFDDPEFCTSFDSSKMCEFYQPLGCACTLFKRILKLSEWQSRRYAVKCDQCKTAYGQSRGGPEYGDGPWADGWKERCGRVMP